MDKRQEIDGPQAEQLDFVPCGQIFQNSKSERRAESVHSTSFFWELKNVLLVMDKVNTGKCWISSHILQNINLDIWDVGVYHPSEL